MRWRRTWIIGNDGKKLDLYEKGDMCISLSINVGLRGPGEIDKNGHYWQYEITRGRGAAEIAIGQAPTLTKAKEIANKK